MKNTITEKELKKAKKVLSSYFKDKDAFKDGMDILALDYAYCAYSPNPYSPFRPQYVLLNGEYDTDFIEALACWMRYWENENKDIKHRAQDKEEQPQ